jgi:hypothetical protein
MFTIPGATPQSGMTVTPLALAAASSCFWEDDLGVATEVAKMGPGLDREAAHFEVEVIRQGAHHGLDPLHGRADGGVVAPVERDEPEPRIGPAGLEKGGQRADVEVGEPDFSHRRLL